MIYKARWGSSVSSNVFFNLSGSTHQSITTHLPSGPYLLPQPSEPMSMAATSLSESTSCCLELAHTGHKVVCPPYGSPTRAARSPELVHTGFVRSTCTPRPRRTSPKRYTLLEMEA